MENQIYHKAKTWQIALFAMNNSATNAYMFLMMYISYYATGIAGLGVAVVGVISTMTRLWDGVTDPVVGFFIDKTNGKFGKFRPFMILGNVILAVMVLVIYGTVHLVPASFRLIYYILCYMIYIVGYTFQTACTKAGQNCLTSDPMQRPKFALFDSVWAAITWSVLPIIASGPLYNMMGGFTAEYFLGFSIMTIIASGILTILAVIGIWEHDNEKYFGTANSDSKKQKVTVKDFFTVIKHNRALQMLIVSASTDKLAASVKTNSVLMVVLFGIFLGNYGLYGITSSIVIIPGIIVALIGTSYAAKKGMKKALVQFTVLNMVTSLAMMAIAIVTYVSGMDTANMGIIGIVFVVLFCVLNCLETMSSGIVIPMIADCTDYETSLTGKYLPGMIGTVFSFIDKLISSLATTVIALGLVLIGYKDVQPVAEDPMTNKLFLFLLVAYFGLPLLGWIANLIAMKFYPLSKEKMEEIQTEIATIKASTEK